MLANGHCSDQCEHFGRLTDSPNNQSLKSFSRGLWMSLRTNGYACRKRVNWCGFLESMTFWAALAAWSVHCAFWHWDMCPDSYAGLCRGKDKKPNMRMEVVSNDSLRNWFCNFGAPGARTNSPIFQQSSLFYRIRAREWPKLATSIDIDGLKLIGFSMRRNLPEVTAPSFDNRRSQRLYR